MTISQRQFWSHLGVLSIKYCIGRLALEAAWLAAELVAVMAYELRLLYPLLSLLILEWLM